MTKFNVVFAFTDYEVEVEASSEDEAKILARGVYMDDASAHFTVDRLYIADVNIIDD